MTEPTTPASLRSVQRGLLVRLLDEQSQRWRQGPGMPVEAYLRDHPTLAADPEAALDLVYNEVLQRQGRGETPLLEEYAHRFPHLADPLRAWFEVHGALGASTTAADVPLSVAPDGPTGPGTVTLPEGVMDHGQGGGVPGYEILGELGRGGMGIVYKARQVHADRLVALKVIRADRLEDFPPQQRQEWLQRFRTEAQAAARLEHDHVVTVHEVGEHAGQPFYSMRYVEGQSLAQLLREGPLPGRRAAALLEAVARAVAHAHQHGILHRDLKPRNILVDASDRPYVADFGLAKWLGPGCQPREAGMTHTGALLGTPSYMAPEQATDAARVSAASDVYSLGATLYDLLTGRPPFQAATVAETLHQVIHDEPVAPRQLNPGIDRDLETITLECLHKEPRRRYSSAQALADDLRRWRAGEPIRARPVGRLERAWHWCRRNRAVAGLTAAVIVSLLSGVVIVAFLAARYAEKAEEALRSAEEATRSKTKALESEQKATASAELAKNKERNARDESARADKERRKAFRAAYHARALLIQDSWEKGRLDRLLDHLPDLAPERTGGDDLRGFECWFWDRLGHAELRSLRGHQSRVMSLVFSPDGKHLTSTEYYGKVILWDVSTGAPLRTVPGRRQPAGCSPDGKWIAAPGAGNTIRIWELASGRDVVTLNGPAPPAGLPVFSPDGKRLAVPCRNGNLQVWDTRGGRTPLTIEMKGTGPQPEAARLAFSPDGKLLACGDREGSVAVWDTGTGAEVYTLKAHPALVTGLAFSPDGRRLASGGFDRAVRLWDAATGKELLTFRGHADAVEGVAFSPDGRRAASAGRDNTILVWDVASGQELVALKADAHGIYNLAFSPDGQRLASAGIDGALGGSQTIKIWDPVCGVQSLALHPSDRTLDVLHTRDGTPTGSIAGAAEFVFSPDGTRMASIDGSAVRVWDAADGRQLLTLKGHADKVTRVIFSPQSSRRLASVGSDGILKVWDISAGAPPAAAEKLVIRVGPPVGFLGEEHFRALDFSPDSRRLASGTARGEVKVWDADDGKELLSILAHPGFGVTRVAFSPDGKRLASTCAGHQPLKLWDLDTRRQVLSFRGPGEKPWFTGLSFSPDGRRVATCYLVGGGQVWDAATGEVSFPLSRDASRILGLAYSPDGKRLATLGVNAVKVLDATNGNELLTLPGGFTSKGGTAVAFSPDSRRLAVGDRIWDARPWTDELRARRQALGLYRLAVEKWLLKDEVRQCIREQAGVSDAVRQHALALADCYAENPTRLLHASKEVLLKPGAGPEEYRRALRRLEAVFRLQPQMLPHHEHYLGVARYRLGQYPEALKVLARIEYRINRPGEPDRGFRHPEGAPFLAMTRHRLGQKEEARATLDGFRGHIARVEAGLKKFELPAGATPQRKAEHERQQKIAVRQLTFLKELLREAEGCIGGPPRSEKED